MHISHQSRKEVAESTEQNVRRHKAQQLRALATLIMRVDVLYDTARQLDQMGADHEARQLTDVAFRLEEAAHNVAIPPLSL